MEVITATSTPARQALDAYLAAQRRRGRAQGTLAKYSQILGEFVDWVGDRSWVDITVREIEAFLTAWSASFALAQAGRQPTDNTVRLRITALKSLYSWMESHDYVLTNPARKIESPRATRRINDWLRPHEDQALLEAPRTPERMVIYWLRFTGCRYCEGEFALNRDIELSASEEFPYGRITIRRSKTTAGKRVIPILPELGPEVERWRAFQRAVGLDDPDLPFLGTKNGTPMTHTQVWRTVKRVAHRAGVRRQDAPDKSGWNVSTVSPHTLRRTLGSSLINSGVPLNVVSKILGHGSTSITERAYAELTAEQIAAQVLAHI